MIAAAITPRHQWTNGGADVLIVRYCAKDGSSSRGFVYPLTVGTDVVCPDWEPTAECGHGLHGWAWGFSIGEGAEPDWAATWLVIAAKPADVVAIDGKVKFRAGVVRYVGDWQGATSFVLAGQMAWVHHASSGAASATGESGAASATGESGAASATGWRGAASATGPASAAVVTGDDGKAQAGEYGVIALGFYNARASRMEMRCARVGGKDGLKPKTWYRLNGRGEFVECDQ